MTATGLHLRERPDRLAVARLDASAALPAWALGGTGFAAIVRRDEELSIVCDEDLVPKTARAERGMRAFEVVGPLDFSLTGVLAQIAAALADAGIPLFAVATYDTDVVLVSGDRFDAALTVLAKAGHRVSRLT